VGRSLLVGGYLLGRVIPNAQDYLEYIILCIVIITWLPVIITYLKERRRRKVEQLELAKEEQVKH
jgi:membrane-associated protein